MRPNELDDLFIDTLDAMIREAEVRMSDNKSRIKTDTTPTLLSQAFEFLGDHRHGILAAQQRQLDHLSLPEENECNEDKTTDEIGRHNHNA